ncbi:MAG TPA: response regulator transcription factor [Blastocatellia bacterium]|nr:response regulator transcription factor [Blastocatellia bacterium]
MSKLGVFLVDDHPIVRKGLKALVAEQLDMEVVGEAGDGRSALLQAKELLPDVMILDITLPDLNGIQLMEKIKQVCPQVKVLVLTVHEASGYLRQLFQVGAAGYLLKKTAGDELIHAIRVVASGSAYLDPTLAGKMVTTLVQSLPHGTGKANTKTKLSEREKEVLRLMALGFSNKEIAGQLDLSAKTIETYKARVIEKLGLGSRAELVRYALNQGWLEDI